MAIYSGSARAIYSSGKIQFPAPTGKLIFVFNNTEITVVFALDLKSGDPKVNSHYDKVLNLWGTP